MASCHGVFFSVRIIFHFCNIFIFKSTGYFNMALTFFKIYFSTGIQNKFIFALEKI